MVEAITGDLAATAITGILIGEVVTGRAAAGIIGKQDLGARIQQLRGAHLKGSRFNACPEA